MPDRPPTDPADHAVDFARRWTDRLNSYCLGRMRALGVPKDLAGAPDWDGDKTWKAFIDQERDGGSITTGIAVNSGVLNPDLLEGKGRRIWPHARLRDRIDAVIAHEYEEARTGTHVGALKAAAKTKLPISEEARRILRAMAR